MNTEMFFWGFGGGQHRKNNWRMLDESNLNIFRMYASSKGSLKEGYQASKLGCLD